MALRSTQPLTEMGTKDLPVGKGWPERKAHKLALICELIRKCESLSVSQSNGPPRPVRGIALPFNSFTK
jgi:hypothetical protein